ncbi:MAG TPA: hypothetical protein ACFYD4_14590 [Candidatus Wunengus sp. YC61]|uniref:hypothetical protein n=1 Tax=Candidatus Wunengus sp. YC61 TaxID=3367698 RepID=UPI0040275269
MEELFDKWWESYPWPKEYDYTVASYHAAKAAFSAGYLTGQNSAAVAVTKFREIVDQK